MLRPTPAFSAPLGTGSVINRITVLETQPCILSRDVPIAEVETRQ